MSARQLRILGMAGSLRAHSYNAALLRATSSLCPLGTTIEVFDDLRLLPLYDEDLDVAPPPPAVAHLRSRIEAADGVLMVTPEHNASVPAALKNALDWASRPTGAAALTGKPVAIAGASPGALGTVRAQMALRQVLSAIGAEVLARPEVLVFRCHERISPDGTITDVATADWLRELLAGLSRHIRAQPASGMLTA